MYRIYRCICLMIVICVNCHFIAFSQTVPFVNYSIQNGLPESTVYSINIDSKGFLWTGTQSGVSSFDGKQFHTYDSQVGLPDNHVTAIEGRSDGTVWFGHRSGMLSFFRNGAIIKFKHRGFSNSTNVNKLLWVNNQLFIATAGNGVYALVINSKKTSIFHFTTNNGLANNFVNKICADAGGNVWAATNGGLSLIDAGKKKVINTNLPPELKGRITAVCPAKKGIICSTPAGLIGLEDGRLTYPAGKASIAGKNANALKYDARGTIWAATNNGLLRLRNGQEKNFNPKNGLLSNIIYDVIEDREHGIWLGQYDGLSCLKDSPFELYDSKDGLIHNETYATAKDAFGKYWVGTAHGISVFTPAGDTLKHDRDITTKDGLPDEFIYDIFRDGHQNMWVACVNKGAACYLSKKRKLIAYGTKTGLAGKEVTSINEDKRGRIWLATLDSGVAVYDYTTNAIKSYTLKSGFPAKGVWAIYRDHHGELWMGTTNKGLVKMDAENDSFSIAPGQEHLANHDFGSVSGDSHGNIWVATIGDGVYKYSNGKVKQYGSRNGIRSNNPYSIFCDDGDNIWIGTNVGLDHFNPVTETTTSYSKNDGFMGIETNQNATDQFDHDNIWVGTVSGLVRFRTGGKYSSIPPPKVYITRRQLFFNKDTLVSNKLSYNQNYITFEYLGLSLSNADKVRYQYRLKGVNSGWSPPLADSRVSFASLAPGKYTFIVRAGFLGGAWSGPVSYAFEIIPPFYRTWWFIILTTIAVCLAAAWLYRYRVNQLLQLEKVRNKIASDLHDDIGSALSSISIFSEVADQQLQRRAAPEQTREIIGRISHHSRAMLDAMDDIVWAVNPRNDHFNDLEVRMREFAIPLLEARDINFEMQTGPHLQSTRLSMEGRKNIYLIFKECINNILKHAFAKHITVAIERSSHQIILTITDDGKGFDINAQNNRNGLRNLKKRASEIDGNVEIRSKPGDGTTITLFINII